MLYRVSVPPGTKKGAAVTLRVKVEVSPPWSFTLEAVFVSRTKSTITVRTSNTSWTKLTHPASGLQVFLAPQETITFQ